MENARWGPIIRYGKKIVKFPKKEDETRYSPEEAAAFTLEDVKKFIEAELPGTFTKKERKTSSKKKTAPKKKNE